MDGGARTEKEERSWARDKTCSKKKSLTDDLTDPEPPVSRTPKSDQNWKVKLKKKKIHLQLKKPEKKGPEKTKAKNKAL